MARAFDSIPQAVALIVGLAAASAVAAAGGASNDGGKKVGNSFSLLYTATAAQASLTAPSAGTGIASNKMIVSNPYNVPLIQNAGSLHSGR